MVKADQFSFPCQFTGSYPNGFAGYTFLQKTEQDAYHPGIDWNWGAGEQDNAMPVQAIANGTCIHTSEQAAIGYGEIVVLKHELTDEMYEFIKKSYNIDTHIIYSLYAHLKDSNVKLNQEVKRGELIGWIGKSGTTVSHLHQELYKSVPGTSWRYWPKLSAGWTLDKLKQYYIDTFELIENQPSISQSVDNDCELNLTSCVKDRNSHWDFIISIAKKLNIETNETVILAEIDKLIGYEDGVVQKDKQLREAQKQIDDLKRELIDVTVSHNALQDSYDALQDKFNLDTVTISSLKDKLELLEAQIVKPVYSGWKKALIALIDRF